MSWITAWIAACWSGVSSKPKLAAKAVVVRREAEGKTRARRGGRRGRAVRRRCRAPARRPCAAPCPTGSSRAGAAAPSSADAGVARSGAAAPPGRTASPVGVFEVQELARPPSSPRSIVFNRRSVRCRGTWTTGSPILSSDRSLMSALTSLACSCLRRRRVAGAVAKSSGFGDELDRDTARLRRPRLGGPRRGASAVARTRRSPRRAAPRRSRSARRRPRTRRATPRSAARCGCRAAARAGSRAGLRSRRRRARGAASCRRAAAGGAAARARRDRRQVGRARPGRLAASAHNELRGLAGPREELLRTQEQFLGRQDRPLAVVLQEAVAFAGVGPEALQRGVDLAVQRQRGAAAEVVNSVAVCSKNSGRWYSMPPPAKPAPMSLYSRTCSGRPRSSRASARESRARGLVERELAGKQAHLGHRVQAALRVGVEGADRSTSSPKQSTR